MASLATRIDLFDGQIAFERAFAGANLIGLVSLKAMQRKLILFGKDRYRLNSKFGCRPEHTNRDF